MPDDIWYGSDSEVWVGVMADATTLPTTWEYLPIVRATFTPSKEQRDRPQIGIARENSLDPIKPIEGFKRVSGSIVVDADARRFGRWARMGLGAPATTGRARPPRSATTWCSASR